jgi:hypothetical protein
MREDLEDKLMQEWWMKWKHEEEGGIFQPDVILVTEQLMNVTKEILS